MNAIVIRIIDAGWNDEFFNAGDIGQVMFFDKVETMLVDFSCSKECSPGIREGEWYVQCNDAQFENSETWEVI